MSRHRSRAEIDAEVARYIANPKLGDPAWEREWADLLTEKHARARVPTKDELARAFRYIDREYDLKATDGAIDAEQWAEGLAFGQAYAADRWHREQAEEMFGQASIAAWIRVAERANRLLLEQGEKARY